MEELQPQVLNPFGMSCFTHSLDSHWFVFIVIFAHLLDHFQFVVVYFCQLVSVYLSTG